jgi:hypothetical protein
MGRIAVSFSLVLSAAVVTASMTACDVGALPGFAPDASMGGSGSGSGSGSNVANVCEELNPGSAPDGHHNEGMNCIAAGCHLETQLGVGAPAYSYAGTFYTDATGTAPMAGATVFVTFNGVERKVLTASNGNFFITTGVGGLESPTNTATATTRVSGCPTVSTPMVGALVQGGGNCNNCHKIGGTTTPMHL